MEILKKKGYIVLGLLGVYLTTVGATLIYNFYKENNNNVNGRKRKSASKITSIELEVPNSTVAAVIGKGGYRVQEIEIQCDVTIRLQKPQDLPNSKSANRICMISGPEEGVKLAKIIIQNIIETVPVVDKYEFYVPHRAVKHILGNGRENLMNIQAASNTKVVIDESDLSYKGPCHPEIYSYDNPSNDDKKKVVVHGTVEEIEVALNLIEEKIKLEDRFDNALCDFNPVRIPGAYGKLLNDELPDDPNLAKIMLSPLPAADAMEVYVTGMITPNKFWIQILSPGIIYLESLESQMTTYYDDEDSRQIHALKEITIGLMVAAKCAIHDKWYRGEVTNILEDSKYKIFLLDRGEFISCTKDDILELRTDMLGLRLQAVECTLANIKPIGDEWSTKALESFAACTWLGQSKIIDATVKGYIQRPADHKLHQCKDTIVLCVDLYDRYEKHRVGQRLINAGYAEYEENIHSNMTDVVVNMMKRQFLSARLLSKNTCLTSHVEEGDMNEDKSVPSNLFNSTLEVKPLQPNPLPKEFYEPVKTFDATTSMAKHSEIKSDEVKKSDFEYPINNNPIDTYQLNSAFINFDFGNDIPNSGINQSMSTSDSEHDNSISEIKKSDSEFKFETGYESDV